MLRQISQIWTNKSTRRVVLIVTSILFFVVVIDQVLMPLVIHSRRTVLMPNVIGMPEEQAVEILHHYNLKVHDVRQQYDSTQPAGRVILQMPYPSVSVREGRRVYLVVSRGDELVKVPSLIGMTFREAQLTLLRDGLKPGIVEFVYCDSSKRDVIVQQMPPAGILTKVGAPINITLCRDTMQRVEVPNLLYRTTSEAQQLLIDANLQLGEVIYQHDETFTPGTILRQDPLPRTRVQPHTQVRIWISSNL